ncbi:hypothetical protein QQG55_25960 [Brugia pahangi]
MKYINLVSFNRNGETKECCITFLSFSHCSRSLGSFVPPRHLGEKAVGVYAEFPNDYLGRYMYKISGILDEIQAVDN